MKKIYLFLLAFCTVVAVQAQSADSLQVQATAAYEAGRFDDAITAYKQLEQTAGVSADLYYNLGNAYFKNKNYPQAIIQYERCLLTEPSHADAQANLDLAKMHVVDKIESIDPVIFTLWSNALRDQLNCDTWGVMGIVCFLLFIVCLFAYFFTRAVRLRKAGFFIGIVSLLFCWLCIYYADAQYDKLTIRDSAVIITPSVTVKSSPADSGTQLFPLHEGTKVKVRSTLGEWSEIELSDGNVGWMPSIGLEII